MGSNILKTCYNALPEDVKKMVGFVPFSLRMGKTYRDTSKFLQKSQTWSREELDAYRFNKLKDLLVYAEQKVPYYKRLFQEAAFDPQKFNRPEHLNPVPLLSKKDVFSSYDTLKSVDYNRLNSYDGMTGGTTGEPLKLLFSVESNFHEWAFLHALWKRIGFKPSSRRVSLMGAPFKEGDTGKRLAKFDYFHNQLQLSPQDLDENSIEEYIDRIESFKPEFLYGLASAITLLAKYLKDAGKRIDRIRGILCGSENIFPSQRAFLEEFFGARLYSWYGQTEKVVLGGECEYSTEYHIFSEYGHTELVDANGNIINAPGIVGEIVGTGFINTAMPLIRYKTGDLGEYAENSCQCGRTYTRIKKIVGRRNQDFLIGNKSEQVPLTSLDMQGLTFEKVYQLQFEQKEPGIADLNIVSDKAISEKDVHLIKEEMESQVGKRIRFNVSVVENLKKTASGKVKPCIQHLRNANKIR